MSHQPAAAARIITRLLLGWVLLVMACMAMAAGKASPAARHATLPAAPLVVLAESGHADRDDASCLKAPPVLQALESDIAKSESEPDLSFDSARAQRSCLAPCRPRNLRDASCVVRRHTPLGRGPPALS